MTWLGSDWGPYLPSFSFLNLAGYLDLFLISLILGFQGVPPGPSLCDEQLSINHCKGKDE